MEDLEMPPGSPALQDTEEPEALNDPQDPLDRGIDEETHGEHSNHIGMPTGDIDPLLEDNEPGVTTEDMNEPDDRGNDAEMMDDENDSELEELDEKEFEDFDPSALNIPDKPVAVDADNVGLLGVHKRKRTEEEERERKKKKKEGRREKVKKPKRVRAGGDDEDDFEGGPEMEGKRRRKPKASEDGAVVRKTPRQRTPENEENLDPAERRRRALDRKMDEALKSHRPTVRRKGVHNLEEMADAEIEAMRQKMAKACEADAIARANGEIATHKLKILPEVVELMNRNTIQSQLVDPDTNILEAVRFMLEPADHDAALPNYQIQKELFAILKKLRIGKDALIASGIGKVVLFYTRSIQPQPDIKRTAERLVGEWMRVVLGQNQRSKKRDIQTRTFDPLQAAAAASQRGRGERTAAERAADADEKRRKILAQPIPGNRARADGSGLPTYTVAPVNNMSSATVGGAARGVSDAKFRRLVAKHTPKGGRK